MKKNNYLLDKEFPESKVNDYYDNGRKRINNKLHSFYEGYKDNPQLLLARWEDIRSLVDLIDGRIHYWESRRTLFLQLTTAILGVSLAGILAISNVIIGSGDWINRLLLFGPILGALFVLIIGSIIIIRLWNTQNNPCYPFTKGYKIWRWQYRGAENKPSNTEITSYTPESIEGEVNLFSENLYQYKSKFLNADIEELIDQDLSQVYLCITNEKFKIKFVSKLRDTFFTVLVTAFWTGIFVIVLDLIYLIFFF